jgi:ethanolamine permease
MLSFVLLRLKFPKLARPYRSPLGIPGAVLALAIAVVTLVALFVVDPIYRVVVLGAAIWYALGLVYFGVHARHHLVFSPEEAFAARYEEEHGPKRP